MDLGNSPAGQWLGLSALTAKGLHSIPGQAYKILQAKECGQKKKGDWSSEDRPIATAKLPRTGRGSLWPPTALAPLDTSLSLAVLTLELLKFDLAAVATRECTWWVSLYHMPYPRCKGNWEVSSGTLSFVGPGGLCLLPRLMWKRTSQA